MSSLPAKESSIITTVGGDVAIEAYGLPMLGILDMARGPYPITRPSAFFTRIQRRIGKTMSKRPNILSIPALKGSIGLFISPQGACFVAEQSHIHTVIWNPARFGLTSQEIEATYAQQCEPLGIEGVAREEILRALVMRGWIRLRRYVKPREQWSATVAQLDKRTRALLREWAGVILAGTLGYREDDPFKPLAIKELATGRVTSMSLFAASENQLLGSQAC